MDERIGELERRIGNLDLRVDAIEAQMRVNTEALQAIKGDTAEIIAIVKGSKIGGKIMLWLAMVGSATMSIYAAFKDFLHGKP